MKVLIVGTDFNEPSDLKTQGQYLKDLLSDNHVDVSITSVYRNPVLRILDTVWQILCLNRKDIVIIQIFGTRGIYLEALSGWLAKRKKCYVINTIHGGNIPVVYNSDNYRRKLFDIIFANSDTITTPSNYISSNISSIRNKCFLIRNHINLEQYSNTIKPNDCIRIFWMRSYHQTYDPFKAIQVLENIRNRGMEAKLVMAGKDFGYKNEIVKYVQSSQYREDITVLDVIDTNEKNNIAAQSNIYLCTNIIDNAPVSFLEMMAMGLPIVTTNVGGIPFYVTHNQTALISTDNSTDNLSELIVQLYQNTTLHQHLVAQGLTFITEFSAETVAQKWLTLFQQLPTHPIKQPK